MWRAMGLIALFRFFTSPTAIFQLALACQSASSLLCLSVFISGSSAAYTIAYAASGLLNTNDFGCCTPTLASGTVIPCTGPMPGHTGQTVLLDCFCGCSALALEGCDHTMSTCCFPCIRSPPPCCSDTSCLYSLTDEYLAHLLHPYVYPRFGHYAFMNLMVPDALTPQPTLSQCCCFPSHSHSDASAYGLHVLIFP